MTADGAVAGGTAGLAGIPGAVPGAACPMGGIPGRTTWGGIPRVEETHRDFGLANLCDRL